MCRGVAKGTLSQKDEMVVKHIFNKLYTLPKRHLLTTVTEHSFRGCTLALSVDFHSKFYLNAAYELQLHSNNLNND